MFTPDQPAAVVNAFSLGGYHGLLMTASVSSEDERIFVLPRETVGDHEIEQ